jgi:hypothetical protein
LARAESGLARPDQSAYDCRRLRDPHFQPLIPLSTATPTGATNLQEISYVAQIVSAVTVVVAVVFGIIQVRQARQQRRDVASVELMRAIQDAEFTHSLRLLGPLPPGATADEVRRGGEAYEAAAVALATKYETLGYPVFRGTIPLELVEELVGGVAIGMWQRLRGWAEAVRREQEQPLLLEWFQWLVQELEARGRAGQRPAYERFPRPGAAAEIASQARAGD